MKFKVETAERGQAAYVTDELGRVRIEPSEPADYQHAWRIAEFLSENVNRIAPENLDWGRTERFNDLLTGSNLKASNRLMGCSTSMARRL